MTSLEPATPRWELRPLASPWWPEGWGEAPSWVADAAQEVQCVASDANGRWVGIGASRRGRLHAHRGAAREDAVALHRAGPWLIAAVADGAGSKPFSRIGAALACRAAVAALAERAGTGHAEARLRRALSDALDAADRTLRACADERGIAPSDLRTTLLLAVVADAPGGAWLGAAQIGDGTIAAEGRGGDVRPVTPGDGGDFAGEVAHFVPDPGAVEHGRARIVVEPLAGTRAVLLCSDGVDDCFYPITSLGPTLLAQLRAGVTEGAPGMSQRPGGPVLSADGPSAALAEWLTFEMRGENDDRTLVVLCGTP